MHSFDISSYLHYIVTDNSFLMIFCNFISCRLQLAPKNLLQSELPNARDVERRLASTIGALQANSAKVNQEKSSPSKGKLHGCSDLDEEISHKLIS